MSNVHGLNDGKEKRHRRSKKKKQTPVVEPVPLPEPQNNRRSNRRHHRNQQVQNENEQGGFIRNMFVDPLFQQIRFAEYHKVLFVSGKRPIKEPKDQHYWDMLTFALCPQFSFLSVTFLILLADIAMFILVAVKGLDKSVDILLSIKGQTLFQFGANSADEVRSGQVYRLLSAIFLHGYFLHFFGNVVVTFMFVTRIEYTYGPLKTLIIYLLAGIAANIFSILLQPGPIKVGASTSLFGIMGLILGYVITNWRGFNLLGPAFKCKIVCTTIFILIFIFIFTPTGSSVDFFGHLGGFLSGVWLSSIHTTIVDQQRERVIRIIFGSLFLIQCAACFAVFYTQ